MAKPITLTVRPKIGRGYNGSIGGQDAGEIWDSFLRFENTASREGAWFARPKDAQFHIGGGPVRSIHNYMHDIGGIPQANLVGVYGTQLLDEVLNPIETLSAPYDLYYNNAKNRLFYGGKNNEPRVWNGTLLATWGAVGPTSVLIYESLTTDSVATGVQIHTVGVTLGSPTVTRVTGPVFVTGTTWVGKTIVIDGVEYPIQAVPGISTITLSINYLGATASPVPAQVHFGNRSWTRPPKYTYAYYNPTTGHCTNSAPTLTLAEEAMTNVNVHIDGIAHNPTLNGYGYTKIIIFRTPRDGGRLLALRIPASQGDGNGFFSNLGAGPSTFIDDVGDDSNLGDLIGNKEPPHENDPCPQHTYQAFWHDRFWVVNQAEPWKISYSHDPSLSLGVPEESFPPQYFVNVSSDDGYANGLKVIGTSLVVTTQRYAYFVAGTSPADFELRRLSTRGFGITQRAIDEHPGDSSTEQASAIYVSLDKRLWRHFEGGRIEDIGAPIQGFLDNAPTGMTDPSPYLVTIGMVDKYWLLFLGIAFSTLDPYSAVYSTWVYDFDSQMWMDWGRAIAPSRLHAITCMTSFLNLQTGSSNNGRPMVALYSNDNDAYVGFFGAGVGTDPAAVIKQRYVDHGMAHVKKKLSCIRLFVSSESAPWSVAVSVDYHDAPEHFLRQIPVVQSPREKGEGIIEFVPNGEVIHYHALSVRITIPGDPSFVRANQLYRYDIDCTPEETLDMGSPA